ncbi:MAG: hypothetical protein K2J08_07795 [Ruminococcus sp.]|nr:hypothetical protein [Ruminococcus sp.]
MKNKKSMWLIAVVVALPFLVMLGLHIGIALGNYFHININVPNIKAADWFMFFSSYLGGSMTLIGVTITLRYERNIHQYENALEKIEKEKEKIGNAICGFNLLVPSSLYLQVNEMLIPPKSASTSDIVAIRLRVNEEMNKLLTSKAELEFTTDIYFMGGNCTTCKKPCGLQSTIPEFIKTYEAIGVKIYSTLSKINDYILVSERNIAYRYNGCENQIQDIKPYQNEINAALEEIAKFNENEIPHLKVLGRNYIEQKSQNAYKKCFPVKED